MGPTTVPEPASLHPFPSTRLCSSPNRPPLEIPQLQAAPSGGSPPTEEPEDRVPGRRVEGVSRSARTVASSPTRPWFVQDDETVELVARPGTGYSVALWAKLALPWTVLAVLALAGLRFLDVPSTTWIWPVYAAGLVVMAILAWRRQVTSLYVVTDKRLYAKRGRLRQRLDFTSHDRVSNVEYNRGIWDKLVGVGDVTFATAGDDIRLPGVTDPSTIQATATQARDAFVEHLLERAGLDEATLGPALEGPAAEADRELDRAPEPASEPGGTPGTVDPEAEGLARYEGPRPGYVRGSEQVRWLGKPNKKATVQALGGGVFGVLVLAPAAGPVLASPFSPLFVPALVLVLLAPAAFRWLALENTELAITDQRVYLRRGIVSTNVNQVAYDKVTDISYNEGVLGRLLGYATLEVNTSGSTAKPIKVPGLTEGLALKRLIERASEA